MSDKATLHYDGREINFDVVRSTQGNHGIDISDLRSELGIVTLDSGFANTAPASSEITFINGSQGMLQHRGYRIEDLAEHCTFLEVVHLLLFGSLPTRDQLDSWTDQVLHHTLVREELKTLLDSFPVGTHPMHVLPAAVNALAAYHTEFMDPTDPDAIVEATVRLIAKLPTISAFARKKAVGHPYVYPRNDLDYVSNFLNMCFAVPAEEYELDPVAVRAMDILLILHADHEQNCSTSAVRLVGSSRANLFSSVAAGINALSGPLHGGANQAVIEMLRSIHEDPELDVDDYIVRAKDRDDPFRLMGFGHRVYRNYDPRARILKSVLTDVLTSRERERDPLLEIARRLEQAALEDDFFVERKLYPNVDFYSGLLFRTLGFGPHMFTALFALGRLPGWIAQWQEMVNDPTTRIGRPRQIYTGYTERDFVPINDR